MIIQLNLSHAISRANLLSFIHDFWRKKYSEMVQRLKEIEKLLKVGINVETGDQVRMKPKHRILHLLRDIKLSNSSTRIVSCLFV